MIKFRFSILMCCVLGVTGCVSTTDEAYLNVKNGANVVEAYIENPYPDCESDLEIARLDKDVLHRVYIDSDSGGVCK